MILHLIVTRCNQWLNQCGSRAAQITIIVEHQHVDNQSFLIGDVRREGPYLESFHRVALKPTRKLNACFSFILPIPGPRFRCENESPLRAGAVNASDLYARGTACRPTERGQAGGQMPTGPAICRGPGQVRTILSRAIQFIIM